MGVNHLGHFYLTFLLWTLIKAADEPRVINVASRAHLGAGWKRQFDFIDFGDFFLKKGEYAWRKAYSRSKMANVLFTRVLQHKMNAANINGSSFCLHPGVILTEIAREFGGIVSVVRVLFMPVLALFFKNCKEGCQTTLHLAL